MPVEFLTDGEAAAYGRFTGPPSQADLERVFFLDDDDRRRVGRHRGDHMRAGFALQLVTVRWLGGCSWRNRSTSQTGCWSSWRASSWARPTCPAACQAGAGAVFAFPLRIGGIRAGVMGLYRDSPGRLSDYQLGDALIFADTAALLLIDASGQSAGEAGTSPAGQPADLALHRAEIDQATGMLTEQLGVGITEAFVRLRAYAYAHDRRLGDLARDIVARRVRLRPEPGLSPDSPV